MTELNFNFCLPMIIQSKIDALNTKLLRLTLLDSHCLWTTKLMTLIISVDRLQCVLFVGTDNSKYLIVSPASCRYIIVELQHSRSLYVSTTVQQGNKHPIEDWVISVLISCKLTTLCLAANPPTSDILNLLPRADLCEVHTR